MCLGRSSQQQEPVAEESLHDRQRAEQRNANPQLAFSLQFDSLWDLSQQMAPLRGRASLPRLVNLTGDTLTDTLVCLTDLLGDSSSSQVDVEDQPAHWLNTYKKSTEC